MKTCRVAWQITWLGEPFGCGLKSRDKNNYNPPTEYGILSISHAAAAPTICPWSLWWSGLNFTYKKFPPAAWAALNAPTWFLPSFPKIRADLRHPLACLQREALGISRRVVLWWRRLCLRTVGREICRTRPFRNEGCPPTWGLKGRLIATSLIANSWGSSHASFVNPIIRTERCPRTWSLKGGGGTK